MNKVWLTLLAVGVLGYCALTRPRASGAGDPIDWSREPVQEPTDRPAFAVDTRKGEMTLEPRAAFDISARVASDERYRADDGAFLVPVDLVMTWGELPAEPYRSKVSYGQMARFYAWHTSSPDLDLHYVSAHSANMHMIPANDNVRRALLAVDGGDLVRVHGLLVNAKRADGFYWNSSLTREDTGQGACELVWVEEIQIGRKVYR